jgi:hypothetical protein
MRSVARSAVKALLWGLVAVLLCGCQARLIIDIDVRPRGNGDVTVALEADRALLERADEAGADPLGELARTGQELETDGWRTTDESTATGGRRVALQVEFDDPDEFNALMATLVEALDAPEVRLVERLTLEHDRLVTLDGVVGVVPGPGVVEFGLDPAEAVELAAEHDAFVLAVQATLPGDVLQTSADQGPDPLRWVALPGDRVAILAVSDPPAPLWRLVALAAVAALGVLVGVLVGVRLRRSRARP